MKIDLTAIILKNSEGVVGISQPKTKQSKQKRPATTNRLQVGVKTGTMFKSFGVTIK